jgi:NAD(P)-dependent dehydrogenase (short-subunit alcohol dehydrogenase family)
MGVLDGRVAIITGAGRGVGREHALLYAHEGAKVVVNDLGGAEDGTGSDASPAEEVAAEIRAAGGTAIANHDDVADWEGGQRLINAAISEFGDLHVLVNNAGILRDRMLVNMTEQEWDAVIHVHLKGHFVPTRFAAAYWREKAKAGDEVNASVINTSSTSGLFGNAGQTNYGAAKSGIASFTTILQQEIGKYGVRCNAIAPAARTRLTMTIPGAAERMGPTDEGWDPSDPANIAPFVAHLGRADCRIAGKVFFVRGGDVHLFQPWTIVDTISTDGRWEMDDLAAHDARFADREFDLGNPFRGS